MISLQGQRGQVVALTFLYSTCWDLCRRRPRSCGTRCAGWAGAASTSWWSASTRSATRHRARAGSSTTTSTTAGRRASSSGRGRSSRPGGGTGSRRWTRPAGGGGLGQGGRSVLGHARQVRRAAGGRGGRVQAPEAPGAGRGRMPTPRPTTSPYRGVTRHAHGAAYEHSAYVLLSTSAAASASASRSSSSASASSRATCARSSPSANPRGAARGGGSAPACARCAPARARRPCRRGRRSAVRPGAADPAHGHERDWRAAARAPPLGARGATTRSGGIHCVGSGGSGRARPPRSAPTRAVAAPPARRPARRPAAPSRRARPPGRPTDPSRRHRAPRSGRPACAARTPPTSSLARRWSARPPVGPRRRGGPVRQRRHADLPQSHSALSSRSCSAEDGSVRQGSAASPTWRTRSRPRAPRGRPPAPARGRVDEVRDAFGSTSQPVRHRSTAAA